MNLQIKGKGGYNKFILRHEIGAKEICLRKTESEEK